MWLESVTIPNGKGGGWRCSMAPREEKFEGKAGTAREPGHRKEMEGTPKRSTFAINVNLALAVN